VLLPFASKDRYKKIQKGAVSAKVSVNNKDILVYSVHFGVIISTQLRKEQARTIIASIPPLTRECIICGDFNTYFVMHNKAIKEVFAEADFKLATEKVGWTYKYWYLLNYKGTLDHIFYKGLKPIKTGKVLDRTSSDHLPIWAEFE